MSTVTGVTSAATPRGNSQVQPTNQMSQMNQQDFLRLLIAQLRNQDPLQPMEDKEFMSQLAQFNMLEQMQQMNENLQKMSVGTAISQASNLLGKQVEAEGPNGAVRGIVSGISVLNGQAVIEVGTLKLPASTITRLLQPSTPG